MTPSTSTTMGNHVHHYIHCKRGLGYAMKVTDDELRRIARYADAIGHKGAITNTLTLDWAQFAQKDSRLYHARSVEMVCGLAKFESMFDPSTEIPPSRILGKAHHRIRKYSPFPPWSKLPNRA